MRRRLLFTIATLVAAGLAAGAVPAFTADTGTISVTVKAQAAVGPCLTVTPGAVNFGPLPFSTSNSAVSDGNTNITVGFCGTATGQNLLGSTTPATGPSGSWTPLAYDGTIHPCPALNEFYLYIFEGNTVSLEMIQTPAPVLASHGGPPAVFPTGEKVFRLGIYMPCQGSSGAGDTKTLTATFTAVVA
jgi:hypothetical protein